MRYLLYSLLVAGVLGWFSGCSDSGGSSGGGGSSLFVAGEISKGSPDAPDSPPNDMTAGLSLATSLDIITDGVDTATVLVNGVECDPITILITIYLFLSETPPAVNAGDTVTATITYGSNTVTVSGTMPVAPTITAPSGGATVGTSVTVTWDAFTVDPDSIQIYVDGAYTASGEAIDETLAGSATTYNVTGLSTGHSAIPIQVIAVDEVSTFTGSTISGSYIEIENISYVNVNND